MAPAKKRGSIVSLIGVMALLISAGVGGYYGYTEFYKPETADIQPDNGTLAENDEGLSPPDADSPATLADDPFDDSAPITSKKPKREASAPRLAQHTTDAIPIQKAARPNAGSRRSKPHPLHEETELTLDEPHELDEPEETAAALDADGNSEPPLLRVPQQPRDRRATADAGRRDDETLDATESEPGELDPETVADKRSASGRAESGKGPKISIVEVQDEQPLDEQLEGFEPVEGGRRRAIAKTNVVRPESAPPAKSPDLSIPEEIDDGWVVDKARNTRSANATPSDARTSFDARGAVAKIQPRAKAMAGEAGSLRELRPAAGTAAQSSPAPRSDTHTVAPNDNFWSISRKQYGTGRYFAALARHNQERIPDPQRLRPGMQVSTPPAALLEERYPELIDKSGAPPSAPVAAAAPPGESADGRPRFGAPSPVRPSAENRAPASSTGYFYSKGGEPLYRIGADDTLSSIAQRHLGRSSRWTEIYEQNRAILNNPENLPLGAVIRLPPDASRVGLAPEVERRR